MPRIFGTLLISAALTVSSLAQGSSQDALRQDLDFARQKIYPALVNIAVVARQFQDGRMQRFPAAGSGVIVSPAGHVVTNYHVAGEALSITCTLPTGETIPADIVAPDAPTDLCILKLRLDQRPDRLAPLPFATLGDSDKLQVGDHVIAVGNPLTLSSSMTLGIVSNMKRVFTDFTGSSMEELDVGEGNATGMFTRWIQHDALILPGNSGGPLVNLRGEIVGINTRGGNGVGFASPSSLVARVLNQVMAFGEVRRGWLGISVMPVGKLGLSTGALVSAVQPGSTAEKAGILPGDVIVKMAGQDVVARFFEEVPLLYQRIAELAIGSKVAVVVHRNGKEENLSVEVAQMDRSVGEEAEFRKLGISVQDITAPMALSRRYPSDEGVLLTGVRAGFPFESAQPRLTDGDVIEKIDGKPIKDLDAFKAAIDEAAKKPEFQVAVRRDRESVLTVVKSKVDEPDRKGGELAKAWIGVKTQVLTTEVAKSLGVEGKRGFRITEVYPWTKAAEAGLLAGDLLVEFDGQKLSAYRVQDQKELTRIVEDRSIGEEVELTIIRDGKEQKSKITLEESPASATEVKKTKNADMELAVRDITFTDRIKYRWTKEESGVIVGDVGRGSWLALAGLREGDLIRAINDSPVTDCKSFDAVAGDITTKKPSVVKIFVRRGFSTTFVIAEPDWARSSGKK